ncbi:MAG: phosphate acyltransferase PlsX [Planctomycetota bacterium]|jgi:glycerol-3-phosphate acyltransferase PlsX
MRIAVDAMGGDNAPEAIIAGVLEAREALDQDDELVLIGDEAVIDAHLQKLGSSKEHFHIFHAPDVIDMDESPVEALRRKPKSSIAIMARAASHRQVDAVLSAGNTGACVAGCQLRMRTLEGVNRPGITAVFPTYYGPVTICDVGANISCKPMNLYQYAVMSSIFAHEMLGIEKPRVGLMNIGEEDAKGNTLVKKTRELIKADSSLNYVGNLEGRDIFQGTCDVVICEGFLGNVILKLTEGLVDMIFAALADEVKSRNKLMALWFKSVAKDIFKKYDYHEYGGAMLLGVNGVSVICHGSSKARTIKNAILTCKKFDTNHINQKIIDHLKNTVVSNGQ